MKTQWTVGIIGGSGAAPGRRRGGLHARREPTIEEVRESNMRKIDAIERAEARGAG